MYLCLTYDHRVLDGASAVQFLQGSECSLEQPWLRVELQREGAGR